MIDAIIISDIHLGSPICNHESVLSILNAIHNNTLQTKKLILNGDVFDSHDFRRLNKHHWKILSQIRKLSDHIEVIWIVGNHDGPLEIISPLLGINAVNELILESNNKKFFITHGHRYDQIITNYPLLVKFADFFYRLFQKLDKTQTIAKFMKQRSKIYLRNVHIVKHESLKDAKKLKTNGAICGHTHKAELIEINNLIYANSGCFTEKTCTFLTIQNGTIELQTINPTITDCQ
jgi:UDP-2,3-diacylglucosamine pyrophosphatase LpxH